MNMRKLIFGGAMMVALMVLPAASGAGERHITGAAIGAGIGAVVAGPPGALVGGAVGAYVMQGRRNDDDRRTRRRRKD